MKYSQDFIDRIITEFPDWKVLHEYLNTGNEFVGKLLQYSISFSMTAESFLTITTDPERLKEWTKVAQTAVRRQKLYSEYQVLYHEQFWQVNKPA